LLFPPPLWGRDREGGSKQKYLSNRLSLPFTPPPGAFAPTSPTRGEVRARGFAQLHCKAFAELVTVAEYRGQAFAIGREGKLNTELRLDQVIGDAPIAFIEASRHRRELCLLERDCRRQR